MRKRTHCIATVVAGLLGMVTSANAATEPLLAKDILEVTVLALKGDRQQALDALKRGNAALRGDDDVYAYCIDARGRVLAHGLPELVGRDITRLADKTGKEFGAYILTNAKEGQLGFTGYYLPRPGGSKEIYREDYFTRVGDLTCGAGYYTTHIE
jgi:signal transduction histidine kinase